MIVTKRSEIVAQISVKTEIPRFGLGFYLDETLVLLKSDQAFGKYFVIVVDCSTSTNYELYGACRQLLQPLISHQQLSGIVGGYCNLPITYFPTEYFRAGMQKFQSAWNQTPTKSFDINSACKSPAAAALIILSVARNWSADS